MNTVSITHGACACVPVHHPVCLSVCHVMRRRSEILCSQRGMNWRLYPATVQSANQPHRTPHWTPCLDPALASTCWKQASKLPVFNVRKAVETSEKTKGTGMTSTSTVTVTTTTTAPERKRGILQEGRKGDFHTMCARKAEAGRSFSTAFQAAVRAAGGQRASGRCRVQMQAGKLLAVPAGRSENDDAPECVPVSARRDGLTGQGDASDLLYMAWHGRTVSLHVCRCVCEPGETTAATCR